MTQELSKKKGKSLTELHVFTQPVRGAEGGCDEGSVIFIFYLQTFGSALSWWKPLVPSFISCIELPAKNGFSRLCAGFLRSEAMPSSAPGVGGPRSFWGAAPKVEVSPPAVHLWKESRAHSCSFAHSPELDTC